METEAALIRRLGGAHWWRKSDPSADRTHGPLLRLNAIALAAMKTKSHGTAFAYPVAPLVWKSGTRHVLMARAGYVARPIAMSSTVTLSRPKSLSRHLSSQGAAISGKPDDVEVAPDTIAAGFKVMVDFGLLDTGGPTGPPA
jgi:hypothetical protein